MAVTAIDSLRKRSDAVIAPSVRAYQTWTPQQIRDAESAADAGLIRHAADLVEWMIADDKVRGAIDGRISSLFGRPLQFDASGDRRRSNRAVKALEVGEDWDAIFSEPEVTQIHYWGVLLGLAPFLNRWAVLEEHDGRDVPVVEFYHPQSLRFDWPSRTWKRRTSDFGAEETIEFGDGVWGAHMPYGTFRPWSLGLWRSIAPWALLKSYAISDWGRLGESASRNVVETVKDAFSSLDLRKELADDIANMARDSAIVLPPGMNYRLIEASASTKELYDSQIKVANTAIAIAIRGGNLTTNVDSGSRAAAEVQERGELSLARKDGSAWSTTAHDQTLRYWAVANFSSASLAPWPVYSVQPEEDRKEKADIFDTAMTGIQKAQQLGFDVDRKAFADEFGFAAFLKPGTVKAPPSLSARGAKALNQYRLASGTAVSQARGFVEGQIYADALTETGAIAGHALAELTIESVLEEVEAANDYEELRQRLRARYATLSADDFAELVYRHMVVAAMAGQHSVDQDA